MRAIIIFIDGIRFEDTIKNESIFMQFLKKLTITLTKAQTNQYWLQTLRIFINYNLKDFKLYEQRKNAFNE